MKSKQLNAPLVFEELIWARPFELEQITPKDSLEHTFIMGPTGSGKSTVMLNLALEDIKAGRSVLVVDPKNDFVNDILARLPEERIEFEFIDIIPNVTVTWALPSRKDSWTPEMKEAARQRALAKRKEACHV